MNKKQGLRAIQAQRYLRYGIRKFTVGVASVAISAGFLMIGNPQVQANEAEPVRNAQVESSTKPEEKAALENRATTNESTVEEVSNKVQTDKLEELVSKVEAKLGELPETKQTKSVIDSSKELVRKAQELLSDATKTQEKVNSLTKQLSSQITILNSIKTTGKEEKQPKNNDSRNGQAIPGNGESGFREAAGTTTTTVTNDVITPTMPAKPTAKNIVGDTSTVSRDNFTGWDTYTMPFGVQSGSGTLGVDTPDQKAAAEGLAFRVFSDQRAGTREVPGPSNFTYKLQASDVKARIDYGLQLSAEEVQKIIEEAELWRGKMRYDGSRIQGSAASTYYGSGAYEYLISSIYKLGYEQGIDKVYIKDASKRIEVTEEAKAAGWTVSDFTVYNFPGATYDK